MRHSAALASLFAHAAARGKISRRGIGALGRSTSGATGRGSSNCRGGLIGTSCSRARLRQILPTGTKATRGHFLNSFGEAVIIAELDHAAVAAERVAQLTEG